MYRLENARTPEQRAHMERLAAVGRCILCDPGNDLLYDAGSVYAARNRYPYPDARGHYLLVPRRHVVRWDHLGPTEQETLIGEIDKLIGLIEDADGNADYEVRWRSGDPAATGATIEHLHIHVIGRQAR